MRLFLVRHAKAAHGVPDEARPLTRSGRASARELGDRLASERLDAVVAVGHEPDCSEIILALTGREVSFPAGSVVEVEL